jgi:uncharacterized membrane protein
MLLTEQRALIACSEREVVTLARHVDRLENEIGDLHDELEALRTTIKELRPWRDHDHDDDDHDNDECDVADG